MWEVLKKQSEQLKSTAGGATGVVGHVGQYVAITLTGE